MADELDIVADRNLSFLYDVSKLTRERDIMEFKKHTAIRHLAIGDDGFYMNVDTSEDEVYRNVLKLVEKLKKTLEECIDVVRKRTPFDITQDCITVIPE